MTLRCNDCHAIFGEDEMETRKARLEDGVSPWIEIAVCPCCGSDDLKIETLCIVCGKPTGAEHKEFCKKCESWAKYLFRNRFAKVYASRTGRKVEEMEGILLDILCS